MPTDADTCLVMKKINDLKWHEFDVKEVFPDIMRGRRLKTDDHIIGEMPYVSSSAMDNGVDNFVSNDKGVRIFSNCLTIANSGSVGATFYHPYQFVASDHVTSLANTDFNKYVYLFIATIASRLSEKYSFNREIKDPRLQREKIMLPIKDDGTPDFDYMEGYMKEIEIKMLKRYKKYLQTNKSKTKSEVVSLEKRPWMDYVISEIGEIKSGCDIYDRERIDGNTPYVTATALQNGIGYFVGNTNETLSDGCISVNRNGSVGYAFYHPYKALFGNDTRRILPYNRSMWVNFFIARAITQQKEKYGYGLKLGTARLKKQSIMLPATADGKPDYVYMEKYMRNIEHRLLTRYIDTRLKSLQKR